MSSSETRKTHYVQQLNNYAQALDKAGQLTAWIKPEAEAMNKRTNGDWCAVAGINGRTFNYGPCNEKGGKRKAEEGAARRALIAFEQLPADQATTDGW